MKSLKPFWRYYGGKYRAAPRYPRPIHDTIIEPFAGAAGYSMRYPDRNVILVEKYEVVAEIWRYLISVDAAEITRIPFVEHVDELPAWVPQPARWLVGFCMNDATTAPCRQLSSGKKKLRALGRKFEGWSDARKQQIASQVGVIRHWRVIEGNYTAAPDVEATWFIDPPYEKMGKYYVHPGKNLDFPSLGQWCQARRGQVIACEAEGATWLPFVSLGAFKSGPKTGFSKEMIWTSNEATL